MPTPCDHSTIAVHRLTLRGAIMEWRICSTDTSYLTDEAESALWDTWETEIDGWTTDRLEQKAKIARECLGRDEGALWAGKEVEVLYDGRRRTTEIDDDRLSELMAELGI